ncbi:MAG: HNH endonuclease [bacterium]|nr:HNH endonuclease [bacterium]
MPFSAPKPCAKPGCRKYAEKRGRCGDHQPEAWASNKGKSRHERGYGSRWDKLRLKVLKRDRYLCMVCRHDGILTKANQVDHIINKAQGGTDNSDNLQAICDNCHTKKTNVEKRHGR